VGGVAAPEFEGLAKLGHGRGRDVRTIEDAVFKMTVKDEEAGGFEAGAGGEELRENVFATAVFFQHLAQTTDLALHAGKAVQQLLLFFRLHLLASGY